MKRLLAFLLLIALGSLALMLALDEEKAGPERAPQTTERAPTPRPPSEQDAVRIGQEGQQVALSGGFTVSRHREVPRQGGGALRQKIYELTCKDSAPFADGKHRLVDLHVKIYDQGKHAADLTASRAIVEMQSNAQKQRELRENRELELQDAKLVSLPDGGLPPIRMELGLVRALVAEAEITLRTPDESQPVLVVVDGERSGELRGNGLRASMPRDRDDANGALSLTILSEPSVRMQGITLRGKGALRYEERLGDGSASIAIDDAVSADLQPKHNDSDAMGGSLTVTGDRLRGWMQRATKSRGNARNASLAWTALRLHGAPARVASEAVDLQSPRITVEPGPTGQLSTIVADGGPSTLLQRGAEAATFRSSQPIRLYRCENGIAATHRAFGFAPHALGAIARMEIVVFDGEAIVQAKDGVELKTDKGMHVFRPQPNGAAQALAARAYGNVSVAYGAGKERIEAKGDSGFLLARTERGDDLRLGGDDPAAKQSFDVRRDQLAMFGVGAARVRRSANGDVTAAFRSATASLAADQGTEGQPSFGRLRNASAIDAAVVGSMLTAFTADGPRALLETAVDGKPMRAEARRIEQVTDAHWLLTGERDAPASLRYDGGASGAQSTLTAVRIDIHRVTERAALLLATEADGQRATIVADAAPANGKGKSHVHAMASTIRVMPFAVAGDSELRRLFSLPIGAFEAATAPMRDPWIQCDTNVQATVDSADATSVRIEARTLLARPSTRSLLLEGDAQQSKLAQLTRLKDGKPELVARGPRIRFREDDGERVTMLATFAGQSRMVAPSVLFQGSSGSLGWLLGECNGEIEVVREAVRFHGPVLAQSVLSDLQPDSTGMRVDAAELTMRRHKDTGELLAVDAGGGVTVRWRDLYAKSQNVELDLRWKRCIAEDADGAQVRFGDGQSYVAQRIEANYETYTVRSYFGRLQQDSKTAAK